MTLAQYAEQYARNIVANSYTPAQLAGTAFEGTSVQGGGGQPPPNTGNRIATQEQYDALPPGTDYIDANGVSGTKPA